MTGHGTDRTQEQLVLRSRLSEIAQIPPWIETLASRHAIPENVQFAINLCLEEAVSNVIRHGYGGETDWSVVVSFAMPRQESFVFVVEDQARRFNPLDAPDLPPMNPQTNTRIGGQGIRLLRQVGALEYEATPTGNRLKMSFSAATSTI